MTPKRKAELKELAKNLAGRHFDDTVSLCSAVSKEYGEELTIKEADYVEKEMEKALQ